MILTKSDLEVLIDALQMYFESYRDWTNGAKKPDEAKKLIHMIGLQKKLGRFKRDVLVRKLKRFERTNR